MFSALKRLLFGEKQYVENKSIFSNKEETKQNETGYSGNIAMSAICFDINEEIRPYYTEEEARELILKHGGDIK